MRYLKVGFTHNIDTENCTGFGINPEQMQLKRSAISAVKQIAQQKGAAIGKSFDGEFDPEYSYLLVNEYLFYDVSSFPSDWSANEITRALDGEEITTVLPGGEFNYANECKSLPEGVIAKVLTFSDDY